MTFEPGFTVRARSKADLTQVGRGAVASHDIER